MKRTLYFDHAGPVISFDTMSGILHVGDLNPQVDVHFVMTPRELIGMAASAFVAAILSIRWLMWSTR